MASMAHKQVLFRSAAREKILRGATQLADAVRVTLGPRSKAVLIEKKRASLDEPAKLIADESVDVEEEAPAEENEPVEGTRENDRAEPPAFEE
jgi:chaperonin GroEL